MAEYVCRKLQETLCNVGTFREQKHTALCSRLISHLRGARRGCDVHRCIPKTACIGMNSAPHNITVQWIGKKPKTLTSLQQQIAMYEKYSARELHLWHWIHRLHIRLWMYNNDRKDKKNPINICVYHFCFVQVTQKSATKSFSYVHLLAELRGPGAHIAVFLFFATVTTKAKYIQAGWTMNRKHTVYVCLSVITSVMKSNRFVEKKKKQNKTELQLLREKQPYNQKHVWAGG